VSLGRIRFELALWSILWVAVIAAAFVVSVVEGAWLIAALAGIAGLVTSRSLFRTSKLVADLHLEDIHDSPVMFSESSEAMVAIDAFDDAIREAPGVPLTDQIRLDRREVEVLLDRVRTTLGADAADVGGLLDQLADLVRRAKPIPLTGEIRLDREDVYDVLDQMRASVGDERSQRS